MSSASTVEGVLNACVRRVRRRWAKGAWKRERPADVKNDGFGKNSYCLEGGCTGGDRVPKNNTQAKAIRVLEQAVFEYTNGRYKSVPAFNDAPETTQIDVVKVAEAARAKARAAGV
jgi:hypothetical protein